jgi:SH3 domain protein
MVTRLKKLLMVLLLLVSAPLVQAETRYVSDRLETPLRAGAALRFKIIRMLPSGTALTVLQTDAGKGYSLVRTPEGTQGWIATQDLMDTPSARDTLSGIQQELEKTRTENALLKKQLNLISAPGSDPNTSLSQLIAENERLSQELAAIHKIQGGEINLNEQNRALQERVVKLERELQLVQQENQSLADNNSNTLFLLGAGVLLGGILLGMILPGLRRKKRERWGDL